MNNSLTDFASRQQPLRADNAEDGAKGQRAMSAKAILPMAHTERIRVQAFSPVSGEKLSLWGITRLKN
jgi:hypothetical protein